MPSRSRVDAAQHISQPRLDRYIVASQNDLDAALDLYEWNVLASGAFFESLGALEIALRNAMHERLVLWCASDPGEWYDDPKGSFNPKTKQAIETPVASLHELRNRIAHHEAIFARDLARDYDYLVEVAEHLHPRLAWWVDSRSRVPQVLLARP
jgi:hypothetical protein